MLHRIITKRSILAAFSVALVATIFAPTATADGYACMMAQNSATLAGYEMTAACSQFGLNSGACNLAIQRWVESCNVVAEACPAN